MIVWCPNKSSFFISDLFVFYHFSKEGTLAIRAVRIRTFCSILRLLKVINDFSLSKVNKFYVIIRVKHDIFRFYISVSNILFLKIFYDQHDLSTKKLNDTLIKSFISIYFDQILKSASLNILHHKVKIFFINECMVKFGQKLKILIVNEQVPFSKNTLSFLCFYKELFWQLLNGILSAFKLSQVNFSISPLAKFLINFKIRYLNFSN